MQRQISNVGIVTDILTIMSDQLDRNLFLVENVLEERDNIQFLDTAKYREVAGLVLKLSADPGVDTSSNATLEHANNKDLYLKERKVILRYLLTHIADELKSNREQALTKFVKVMSNTVKTFNPEFINVLLIILLFDGEHEYRYICKTVADFAINVLHNENEGGL